MGHPNPLFQQLPPVNNSPKAKRTLAWGERGHASHPSTSCAPRPPQLSHKKILTRKSLSPLPRPLATRGQSRGHNNTAQSTLTSLSVPPGPSLSSRSSDLPGRKGTLERSFPPPPKGACGGSSSEVNSGFLGRRQLPFPGPGSRPPPQGPRASLGLGSPQLSPSRGSPALSSLTGHAAVHGGGLLCRYHVVVRHVEA